jgi:hypothetical protein
VTHTVKRHAHTAFGGKAKWGTVAYAGRYPFSTHALYVWRDPANDGTPIDWWEVERLADFAVGYGIDTLYYDNWGCGVVAAPTAECPDGSERQSASDLRAILEYLHVERGLHVEALYTDHTRVSEVVSYNASVVYPWERFDAIRLNIESGSFEAEPFTDLNDNGRYDAGEPFVDVHQNLEYDPGGEWPGGAHEPTTTTDLQIYADAVAEAAGIPVFAGISHHWGADATDPIIVYNGQGKRAYEHILDIVAGVDVQSTWETATEIANRVQDEVCYANSVYKPVHITIETYDVVTHVAGPDERHTFFEEGKAAMKDELDSLAFPGAVCTPQPSGFAYHFYRQSFGSPGIPGWEVDLDRDGIVDAVDPEPHVFSAFSTDVGPGGTTSAWIVSVDPEPEYPWGRDWLIRDELDDAATPAIDEGLRIRAGPGTEMAQIRGCSPWDLLVDVPAAGGEFVLSCQPANVTGIEGEVHVTAREGDQEMSVLVPAYGSATFDLNGSGELQVTNAGATALSGEIEGERFSAEAGETVTIEMIVRDCPGATTLEELVTCIDAQMPQKASNGFVAPDHPAVSPSVEADWQDVVAQMLEGSYGSECVSGITLPPSLSDRYQLFSFLDQDNGQSYCVLLEILDADGDGRVGRGWGTFIVNPLATRELSIQVAHPKFDGGTRDQGITVFKGTNSRTFLMAGTHRHANLYCSELDDQAIDCAPGEYVGLDLPADPALRPKYLQADVAHNVDNMFQRTVKEIQDFYGLTGRSPDQTLLSGFAAIQFHTKGSSCLGVDVYLTNGLDAVPDPSDLLVALKTNLLTASAGASWAVTVPGDTPACTLNGTLNVQGRLLNGVDPTVSATDSTGRFVHVEQDSDAFGASSTQYWIQAIEDTWPTSVDLVFLIDLTGSMWDDIDQVKLRAPEIVQATADANADARIAIVGYKDFPQAPHGGPGDYPFRDFVAFTADVEAILQAIDDLSVGGGGDWQESVYSAQMHAIESTSLGSWRDGVTKTTVLMGDAPPHDPEPFTGYTEAIVAQAALDADPVIMNGVIIGDDAQARASFQALAQRSVPPGVTAEADVATEVVDALIKVIEGRSTQADPGGPYAGFEGSPVLFDGSQSADSEGRALTFAWRFGDGHTSTEEQPTHTYADNHPPGHAYEVCLTVTDPDGIADTRCTTAEVANVDPQVTVSHDNQTVQYSDENCAVTFTAEDVAVDTMTAATTPATLPASLVLTDNGCSVSGGVKTCTWTLEGTMDQPVGDYDVTVTVTDDDSGSGWADTTITVVHEDAEIWLEADNPVAVQVDTPGGDSLPFSLTAYIQETCPDTAVCTPDPGDISNAEVQITLTSVGPGGSYTSDTSGDCTKVGVTGAVLEVGCNFDDIEVNTYYVEATVIGDYYVGGPDENVFVVYDPSLGFATGGGWFYWPDTTDKTSFGYTINYNKKGAKVKGSLLMIRRVGPKAKYRIKSNAFHGLALGESADPVFGWASFSGKSTYLEPGWSEPEGNYEFTAYVEDRNEPGTGTDRFWIEVKDKSRNIVPAMSMDREATDNAVGTQGGNLVVPHRGMESETSR